MLVTLRSLSLWWGLGCAASLLLTVPRAVFFEPQLPYFRSIDLARDIAWVDARMPPEVAAFVAEPVAGTESSGGWRIDGMCLREFRIGEDRTTFVLHRRDGGGLLRRVPEHKFVAERLRRGLPFRCLEGGAWQLPSGEWTTQGLWRLTRPSGGPDIDFPLRILWLGLLADGAIVGAVAWLLARFPRLVERAFRRRRGRCPHCGHPLAGLSTCPECGLAA